MSTISVDHQKTIFLTSSKSSSGVAGVRSVRSVLKEVREEVSESTDSSSNPKYVSTTCLCRRQNVKEKSTLLNAQSRKTAATHTWHDVRGSVFKKNNPSSFYSVSNDFFRSVHQIISKKFSKTDATIWSCISGSKSRRSLFLSLCDANVNVFKLFWLTHHHVYKSSPGNPRNKGRPKHKGKWMQKSKGWGGSTRTCCRENNNIKF